MRPKKAKDLNKPVAESLGMPEEDVKKITGLFWTTLRESLGQLKHIRVHVTNLGDFVTKHWAFDNYIYKLSKKREFSKNEELIKNLDSGIEKISRLKVIQQEEEQRKQFIHKYKKTTYAQTALDKQMEDPTGPMELDNKEGCSGASSPEPDEDL